MDTYSEKIIISKVAKSNKMWAYVGNLDAKSITAEMSDILYAADVDLGSSVGEYAMQAWVDGMGKNLTGDDYCAALADEVEKAAQEWSDECQQSSCGREDGSWEYDEDQEIGRYGR